MSDGPRVEDAGAAGGVPARPSCLVVHGLGGGPHELRPLIGALQDAGLRVLAPCLPGHDVPGRVMPASRWEDWDAAVTAAFDGLAASGAPVAVVGFSTGGTLALHLASRRPVARLALLAPFLAIRFSRLLPVRPALYLGPIARVLPSIPRRRPAVGDPEMRRWARGEERYRTFSLLATLSALELIERVKPLIPSIRSPALILQGRRDSVVEPDAAAWLLRRLGSARKELLWFDRSDHLLTLDRERDRVNASLLAFLLERDVPFRGD